MYIAPAKYSLRFWLARFSVCFLAMLSMQEARAQATVSLSATSPAAVSMMYASQTQTSGDLLYTITYKNRSELSLQWNCTMQTNAAAYSLSNFSIAVGANSGSLTQISTAQSATYCVTMPTAPSGVSKTFFIRVRCNITALQSNQSGVLASSLVILNDDRDNASSDCNTIRPNYTPITYTATQNVFSARNANVVKIQDIDFGWMLTGQTKFVYATDADASKSLRFAVYGEPQYHVTINCPLQAQLTRQGGSETILFARNDVTAVHGNNGSAPSTAPTSANTIIVGTNSFATQTFTGSVGTGNLARADIWVGGSISVPLGTPQGTYVGTYTITLTQYEY